MKSDYHLRGLAMVCILVAAVCQAGCGPQLYSISGQVNYSGRPVKSGTIRFEPSEKGRKWGVTEVEIIDGRFKLPRSKGVAGGPYRIMIVGSTGVPDTNNPYGKALFSNPYITEIELPKQSSTHAFDIPPQR